VSTQDNTHDYIKDISDIAKGAGIVFLGTTLGTILKYIFELIVARNLGTNLFGLFFLGLAFLKVGEIISTLGLHRGVLRYIALFRGEGDIRRTKGTIILSLRIAIIVGIVICILIIFFSSFISENIFKKAELAPVLKMFSLIIPFTTLTTILVFSSQGFKIMKYRVYVREIFEPTIRIIGVVVIFLLGYRLFGTIFVFNISIVIGLFLAFFYLKKIFPELIHKNTASTFETKKILGFSWPLLLADFFGLIVIWMNILMIGYFKDSHEVGVYSAAHRTALMVQVILLSFNAIFSPIIADLYNKKDTKKLERLFKIVTKWILSLSLPVCILSILLAPEILSLFGKDFIVGASCLIVLSLSQLVNSIFGSAGFLIMMAGKSRINLFNNMIAAILNICLNLYLIPRYGITGAAISLLITIAVTNALRFVEVFLLFKFHPFKSDFYKPLLAAGGSTILAYLGKAYIFRMNEPILELLAVSAVFLIIYILISLALGIEEEDKIVLDKIKAKFSA
jgi:O-antigen/teichoic acid export membrane protein